MIASSRFRFAAHYALRHLLLSLGVALASAAVVARADGIDILHP
mgnify:CR=1 FL=1